MPDLEHNISTLQPTEQSSAHLRPVRSSAELYISLASYAFLLIASVAGNGLVIGAYVSNKWLRKAVTHTLIIGLASADFLVGVVSLPIWIYITLLDHHGDFFTGVAYQFYITADIFIGSASILQLTGISVERSHAILRPLQHRSLDRKTFCIAVVAVWLCSAVLAALQPVQYGTDWQMAYTILTATACFFIPTVIIIIAYGSIFFTAKSKTSLTKHQTHKTSLAKEVRLSFTLAMITLLFVITWLPLFALTMLATFNPRVLPTPPTSVRLLHFVKWMHYSSSALNPLLYSYRNVDLRRTISVLLHRLVSRKGPGVDEVFRSRRSSSVVLSQFRKLSTASERSRKISTESQQNTSARSRSGDVLLCVSSVKLHRSSTKEKDCKTMEENDIVC